jgi:hypothetical protein
MTLNALLLVLVVGVVLLALGVDLRDLDDPEPAR